MSSTDNLPLGALNHFGLGIDTGVSSSITDLVVKRCLSIYSYESLWYGLSSGI